MQTLTRREHEVMALLLLAYRDKEIAKELFVTPKTVRRHLSNIFPKLGVKNRTSAMVRYLSNFVTN